MKRSLSKDIEVRGLFEPSDRVVIGLSGGVDSVVLLDLLSTLKISLYIAHVNYGLRGKESVRDEMFVRGLAEKYGVPAYICNGKECMKRSGSRLNVQNAARNIRYDFFLEVARKVGANKIALAHHADDQAETILLHLLRGSGLGGLTGMSPIRRSGNLFIVRPLLDLTKKEIMAYARKKRLKFVEDRTNRTNKYSRNVIRNDIVPLLAGINPLVVQHLCKTASILRDEDEALSSVASEIFNKECHLDPGQVAFSRSSIGHFHPAMIRRVLRLIYGYLTGGTTDLLTDHVEKMLNLINSPNKTGEYALPRGIKFTRNADKILLKFYVKH